MGQVMIINILVPVFVIYIIIYSIYKKVDIFDTFIVGVKKGIKLTFNLFPTIFAMTIAITMITSSNLIYDLSNLLEPVLSILHFPKEVLSLSILRPISGSSSLVLLGDILRRYGPDSFIGMLASVMQGSTDTTIYIIGLYFASIGIKKIRYSLILGLLADLISVIISLIVVSILFK